MNLTPVIGGNGYACSLRKYIAKTFKSFIHIERVIKRSYVNTY